MIQYLKLNDIVKRKVKISILEDKGYAHTTLFPTEAFLCCRKVGERSKKQTKTRGGLGRRKEGSARGPMGILIPFIKAAIGFYGTVSNSV